MAAGTPVLYVPENLILSSSKAMAELQTVDMQPAEKILYSVNADTELRQYYLMIKLLVEIEKGEESPYFPWLNSLPRYYTNAASMTPFCCLCLPSLMRKLAVKERGNMSRLSVSSIKLIPYLNEDTKYDVELCNWVYQIVYTRGFETEDGDIKIVPMGDVSFDCVCFVCLSLHLLFTQITSIRCLITARIILKLNHHMTKRVTIMPTQHMMYQRDHLYEYNTLTLPIQVSYSPAMVS